MFDLHSKTKVNEVVVLDEVNVCIVLDDIFDQEK